MTQPLVTVENVSLALPGDPRQAMALHDIRWTVERGAHCALLGPNGSGKSTLLRLLHGELWPARGRVLWHGPDGPEAEPLAGRAMSALVSPALQETYQRQAWDLTGRDILLTGFEDSPLVYVEGGANRLRAVADMAARLKVEGLLERRLPTFSQGQLRMLLLGRALLRRPALLLLDECDDGLDSRRREIFFAALEEYAQSATVIMAAHRPASLPGWCRGRRHMREGRLYATPPAAAPAPTPPRRMAVPRRAPAEGTDGADHPLLELEHVTVFVERKEVLHDICWSLHRGEHWRVSGANGSGKSTLLRLLAGDEFVADGGRLTRWLPGQGTPADTLETVRRGVRLVSDLSQSLYGYDLEALDMVCTGFDNSIGVYRAFSEAERAEARDALAFLFPDMAPAELAAMERRPMRQVSTGQLRRLFLARALMGGPDILLLDEPCSGLDQQSREIYLQLLDRLSEAGVHLVFVSHHDDDAPLCINREARMEDGRLRIVR